MQWLVAAGLSAREFGDALWAFVHGKEAANAMACTMGVIQAGLPQGSAGHAVQLCASGAFGEDSAGQSDMAFQHTREAVLHLGGGSPRSDPDRAGNIGCAIQILPAAIDQIDAIGFNAAVGAFIDLIMAMRAIGAGGGDGVERQIMEHSCIFAECF